MKADKTSTLALLIAAILLLVVGAMSYRDYIDAKLEKKWADRNQAGEAGQVPAAPVAAAPVNPLAVPAAPPIAQTQYQNPPLAQDPPVAAPPAGQQPGYATPPPAFPPPAMSSVSTPAPDASVATSPKLNEYQANLDAMRQENALLQRKLEEARLGTSPQPPRSAQATSAVQSVGGNPGVLATGPSAPAPAPVSTAADAQKELGAMAEKVRTAPALAKVLEYDPDWAILTINGGRDRNIQEDMRFAVRRGAEILGWAKITVVEANQSIAQLMSPNKHSRTARKPEPGDDIIAFDLF